VTSPRLLAYAHNVDEEDTAYQATPDGQRVSQRESCLYRPAARSRLLVCKWRILLAWVDMKHFLACVSAIIPPVTEACDRPTKMKPVKLFGLTKIVTFRFVELLDLNVPPRQIDGARLALILTLLDFAMDDLPVCGCAAFPKAPLLELAFVLSFAVSMSESLSATQYPRHRSTYLLSKLYVTFM
jgi:hypothetical protein